MGLVSLFSGVVLTSCKTYLKSGESSNTTAIPNDTLFLNQAYLHSKTGQEYANVASHKAANQEIRIYSEKEALFQQRTALMWDSLSKKKQIPLLNKVAEEHKNKLKELAKIDSANFDREYLSRMENQLMSQIDLLENVSTRSEDNDITTLAITLLPEYHSQLDTLLSVKQRTSK
jgi:predicted outer membrane protein